MHPEKRNIETNIDRCHAFAKEFAEQGVIYKLLSNQITDYQRHRLCRDICINTSIAEGVCEDMNSYKREFVMTFDPDDPGLYDRIQLSIGEIIGIMDGVTKTCTLMTMGDDLPDDIKTVTDGLDQFRMAINSIYDVCRQVAKSVEEVRKNTQLLEILYQKACEEARAFIEEHKRLNKELGIDTEQSISKDANNDLLQNNLPLLYHTTTKLKTRHTVLLADMAEERRNGMTEIEVELWGENRVMAMNMRTIVKYFDELPCAKGSLDSKTGKHKLNGNALGMLVNWCRPLIVSHFYDRYFVPNYHGNYLLIGSSSVSSSKNKPQSEEETKEFEQQINALLERYNIKTLPNPPIKGGEASPPAPLQGERGGRMSGGAVMKRI
ncbi:MAG: hypothetical protein ACI3ZB_05340 [Prevotella sp.]